MREFIHELSNKYLSIALLIVGILMVLFPENLSHVMIWALGGAMILRGILVIILCLRYKDRDQGPGKAILYAIMGLLIMYLNIESINIVGVMWAIFSLLEVSNEIDLMWKKQHVDIICLLSSVVTVTLSIMLMINPFEHFSAHVKVLGLTIISTFIAKTIELIKAKIKANGK